MACLLFFALDRQQSSSTSSLSCASVNFIFQRLKSKPTNQQANALNQIEIKWMKYSYRSIFGGWLVGKKKCVCVHCTNCIQCAREKENYNVMVFRSFRFRSLEMMISLHAWNYIKFIYIYYALPWILDNIYNLYVPASILCWGCWWCWCCFHRCCRHSN